MPTTNPVPSADPSDLLFNAQKLDEVVNGAALSYTDRLGVTRLTWAGIAAQAGFVALTDGATITIDGALGFNHRVVLGGNRTLANPTGLIDGMVYTVRIKQDSTGSRTLAYGTKWKWPAGSAPALSTAANAVDLLCAQYDANLDILLCNLLKGFA